MTDTNNTDGAALLPVTQADRDAAADFMFECSPLLGDCGMKNSVELALRQAFARHRQSSSNAGGVGVDARETVARVLWDRLRNKMRGRKGGRSMPHWDTAHPDEHAPYLADADAVLASLSTLDASALWKVHDALVAHHQWHAARTEPDPEHGFIPADEYADSGLYEQTVAAICALDPFLRTGPRDTAPLSSPVEAGYFSHPHIAEPARRIIERVADAVTTTQRESTAAGHEMAEAIAKECIPHFEKLGMSNEGDGWGFDEDLFATPLLPFQIHAALNVEFFTDAGGDVPALGDTHTLADIFDGEGFTGPEQEAAMHVIIKAALQGASS